MKFNQKLPDFQNLINTLSLKKRGRIPLIELGIHPHIKENILGRPIQTLEDDIEFMKMMGYDYIKIQPIINFAMDFGHTQHTTAVDRNWAPEKSGCIQSFEDFENYPWPSVNDIDYSRFENIKNILPENMGVIGQYGDLFTVAWELMGFENFAMATYENPELVKAILDKIGQIMINMFSTMSEFECVGAMWFSDDIAYASGLMLSPDFYRENFFPYLKKIGDITKSKNIPLLYHTDGLLWDVMDDIIACGVNGLHPIEPKAMDIKKVIESYGDKICVCGGIEVDTLSRGSINEIEELVKSFIDKTQNGYWCAGSSNSIPDYVILDNYLKMVDIILNYGN